MVPGSCPGAIGAVTTGEAAATVVAAFASLAGGRGDVSVGTKTGGSGVGVGVLLGAGSLLGVLVGVGAGVRLDTSLAGRSGVGAKGVLAGVTGVGDGVVGVGEDAPGVARGVADGGRSGRPLPISGSTPGAARMSEPGSSAIVSVSVVQVPLPSSTCRWVVPARSVRLMRAGASLRLTKQEGSTS
jgi:hypothetical protein